MTSSEDTRTDASREVPIVPLTQVIVHGLGQEDGVIDATAQLDSAARSEKSRPVQLDFNVTNRVSPQWGTIFANVLAQQGLHQPLQVSLPTSPAVRRQLARAGVFFALARHPWLDETGLSEPDRELLAPWRLNWSPAADESLSLFQFGDILDGTQDPEVLESNFVVFLNPDRSAGFDTEHRGVVHPWLRRLVSQINTRRRLRETALRKISLSISELLENVQRHADMPHRGLSSVSVFLTQGRPDRLYITVTDTGVGMQASLRTNYPQMDESPEVTLARPFDGCLPGRERDRGRGLHRLSGIVDQHRGSLFVATGSTADRTLIVERSGGKTTVSLTSLAVRGTVAVVMLPLQQLTEPVPGHVQTSFFPTGSEPR